MIYFDDLPLDGDIKQALAELKINYVFQGIYQADGQTIYAREALMRPLKMTVTELIEKYYRAGKLHVLEVATFFGAMQEFELRGYEEHVCLNSFPTEFFTEPEQKAFADYYGDVCGVGIIEMLEYPYIDESACLAKKEATKRQRLQIAIDDFGTGVNDMSAVEMYEPDIIKLDRSLIMDIDVIPERQEKVRALIRDFHSRGMRVVAEGIERKGEFDYLVGLGADLFQGYYLQMPM